MATLLIGHKLLQEWRNEYQQFMNEAIWRVNNGCSLLEQGDGERRRRRPVIIFTTNMFRAALSLARSPHRHQDHIVELQILTSVLNRLRLRVASPVLIQNLTDIQNLRQNLRYRSATENNLKAAFVLRILSGWNILLLNQRRLSYYQDIQNAWYCPRTIRVRNGVILRLRSLRHMTLLRLGRAGFPNLRYRVVRTIDRILQINFFPSQQIKLVSFRIQQVRQAIGTWGGRCALVVLFQFQIVALVYLSTQDQGLG